MGFAVATAKKITVPPSPKNESQRRNKVNEVAIVGHDFSQQFEIFPEMVKMIVGVDIAMINILERQFRMVVHSFIRDFKDSSKVAYIEIFMKNSNYDIVETIKNGDCLLDALLYFFIT